MIQDRNTNRKRLLRRIGYHQFGFEPTHTHDFTFAHTHEVTVPGGTTTVTVTSGAASDDAGVAASDEGFFGMDDGAPVVSELSTFGVGGIEIAVAGDSCSCWDFESLPLIDVTEPIGVRVLWTADVATPGATDSVTWVVLFDQFDPGEVVAAAATALSTVIGAHAPGLTTGRRLHRSGRGIINANVFDEAAKEGGLIWNIEADVLTNYSANELKFLALEIDFLPQLYQKSGQGVNVHTKAAKA